MTNQTDIHPLNHSNYLQQLATKHPSWQQMPIQAINASSLQAYWQCINAEAPTTEQLKHQLRILRQWVMWHLIHRDLLETAPLTEITEAMTLLAEHVCQTASAHILKEHSEQFGIPLNRNQEIQDFIIVGMGKLGGRELNVSSDIDLIYIYPEEGETKTNPGQRKLSNQEFFERASRKITNIINDITQDGFVFRVDLRLRPNGDSGPLVVNFDMLEEYFVSQGRTWERYAWLKGRIISTNTLATSEQYQQYCQKLEKVIYPFVWRKYLDFSAIETIRQLHQQINQEIERKAHRIHQIKQHQEPSSATEQNIKLGRGGIRQIEFIAQAHQLIRGGREASLRIKPTCAALSICAQLGLISHELKQQLINAYEFLRKVEHRIQYINDAQTHQLPEDQTQLNNLAHSLKFSCIIDFQHTLNQHRDLVQATFDTLFSDKQDEINHQQKNNEEINDTPDYIKNALNNLYQHTHYQLLNEARKTQLQHIIQHAINHIQSNSLQTPENTINRFIRLIETILKRFAYIALFAEFPPVLIRTLDIIGSSQWAADYLIQHPILLDELLNIQTLNTQPDWHHLKQEWQQKLTSMQHHGQNDVEQQMDWIRDTNHAYLFRLLAQDINGHHSPETLADQLSSLADIVVQLALETCWLTLCQKKNYPLNTPPKIAIIAYGKYGGKELGYGSDLDLVFIASDEAEQYIEDYTRLVQRINTWLSTRTSAGILYETDLRLRPNGNAGLLITNQTAFAQYQEKSAWIWEHQALSRARFCAGDTTIGVWFEALREKILSTQKDQTELKKTILEMREKMRQANPPTPGKYNLKHDQGGLVDIEFIVQYLILAHGNQHLDLLENKGNITLLLRAGVHQLISENTAQIIANTYRTLRKLQHQLRLQGQTNNLIPIDQQPPNTTTVIERWKQIFQQ